MARARARKSIVPQSPRLRAIYQRAFRRGKRAALAAEARKREAAARKAAETRKRRAEERAKRPPEEAPPPAGEGAVTLFDEGRDPGSLPTIAMPWRNWPVRSVRWQVVAEAWLGGVQVDTLRLDIVPAWDEEIAPKTIQREVRAWVEKVSPAQVGFRVLRLIGGT